MMILTQLTSWLLILLFASTNHHNKVERTEIDTLNYPYTLYLEGKRATLFKSAVPFVYIEFNSPDEVYGYMGYFPEKGKLFDGGWKFRIVKSEVGFYSDKMPRSSYDDTIKTSRLYLENSFGTWKITIPEGGKKYVLSLLPTQYDNAKIRNYTYALASFYVLDFPFRSRRGALLYESSYLDEPVFNMNFPDFAKQIDSMSFFELRKLLHIKNKYP